MIAVDTNLLVRIVVNDDPAQTAASIRVLQGDAPVYLLNSVLQELVWVLEGSYQVERHHLAAAIEAIIETPNILLESELTREVVDWYRAGMDIADAIHLAGAASGCETLVTFDKDFIRKAKGKTSCVVRKPG